MLTITLSPGQGRGSSYKERGNHHLTKKKKKAKKDPTPASAYGSAPTFKKNKRVREEGDNDEESLGDDKRAREETKCANGKEGLGVKQKSKRGREKGADDEEGLNKRGREEGGKDEEGEEEDSSSSDEGEDGSDDATGHEGMGEGNAESGKERAVGGGWRNAEKERMAPSAGAEGGKAEYTCNFCAKSLPPAEFNAKKLNSVRRGWTPEDALKCKSCNFKLNEEKTLHEKQGGPLARAKSQLKASQGKRRSTKGK